jgi:hypothetical protein
MGFNELDPFFAVLPFTRFSQPILDCAWYADLNTFISLFQVAENGVVGMVLSFDFFGTVRLHPFFHSHPKVIQYLPTFEGLLQLRP